MSSLKNRIQKLEILVFGEEHKTGLTMEELLHVWRFLDPEDFRQAAESSPYSFSLRQLDRTPTPRNIDRLVQIWQQAANSTPVIARNSL